MQQLLSKLPWLGLAWLAEPGQATTHLEHDALDADHEDDEEGGDNEVVERGEVAHGRDLVVDDK